MAEPVRPETSPSPLEGSRVLLKPVGPQDHAFLYDLAIRDEVSYRWRFRGFVPSFEVFVQSLSHDVSIQFVILQRRTGERIGHVVAYSADTRNGHVWVGMVLKGDVTGTGLGIEAGTLFLNYLFDTWNFVKICGEIPEFNYFAFQSGIGTSFKEEGRLRQHTYYQGRHWDTVLVATFREDIPEIKRNLERIRRSAERVAPLPSAHARPAAIVGGEP